MSAVYLIADDITCGVCYSAFIKPVELLNSDGVNACMVRTTKVFFGLFNRIHRISSTPHIFCRNCMLQWKLQHNTCPKCRSVFASLKIHEPTERAVREYITANQSQFDNKTYEELITLSYLDVCELLDENNIEEALNAYSQLDEDNQNKSTQALLKALVRKKFENKAIIFDRIIESTKNEFSKAIWGVKKIDVTFPSFNTKEEVLVEIEKIPYVSLRALCLTELSLKLPNAEIFKSCLQDAERYIPLISDGEIDISSSAKYFYLYYDVNFKLFMTKSGKTHGFNRGMKASFFFQYIV